MTFARSSPDLGPLRQLTRYLTTHALLAVTAILGGLVILALTAASAGIYDAVAEKDGSPASTSHPRACHRYAHAKARQPGSHRVHPSRWSAVHDPDRQRRHAVDGLAVALLNPLILMIIAVANSLTFTSVGKAIVGQARPPLNDAVPPYEHAFSFLLVTP